MIDSHLLELPSVKRLLTRLCDDLLEHRSVILVTKEELGTNFIHSHIYGAVAGRGLDYNILRPDIGSLEETLRDLWNARIEGRPTVDRLAHCEPSTAITIVVNFEEYEPERQERWLDLLRKWAEIAQGRRGAGKTTHAFLLIFPATHRLLSELPSSNVFLRIHCWSECLTSLEMRLLCQMQSELTLKADPVLWRWREALLPELASADVELAEHLWCPLAEDKLDTDKLFGLLVEYAEKRGWQQAQERPIQSNISTTESSAQQTAWKRRGWIYETLEYGCEVHSGLLALNGDREQVSFRYWRGQARLLMPELDRIRRFLIDHYKRCLPAGWHMESKPPHWPEDEEFGLYDVEWPGLVYHAQKNERLRHLRNLAGHGKTIRNTIAHYKPIVFYQYRRLLELFEEAQSRRN